jgi:hypothetical protein
VDAEPGPPKGDDERAQTTVVRTIAGRPHDGDDLLDGRRIGRVAQPLVVRRTPGAEAGQRRGRTATADRIEQLLGHDPSSGSTTNPEHRPAPEQHGSADCRFPSARGRRRTALACTGRLSRMEL